MMTTLAALCLSQHLDMHEAAEVELTRITQPEMIERIREKQKRKPAMSPLPGAYPERAAQPKQAVAVTDEVRKVVQGLPYQMLFNAIADSVRITGDGHAVSISVKGFKSAIDAALSAHKTGEEE